MRSSNDFDAVAVWGNRHDLKPRERLALWALNGRRRKLMNRFLEKTKIDDETGCWIWQGRTSGPQNGCRKTRGGGYPRDDIEGATIAVHRWVWAIFNGPIPGKKQIDHTCHNRACIRPGHLQLVTHKQNQKRRPRYSRGQETEKGA